MKKIILALLVSVQGFGALVALDGLTGGRDGPFLLLLARASPSPAPAPNFRPRIVGYAAALEELEGCFTGDCNFPRPDEDTYRRAVSEEMRAELLDLKDWAARNRVRDPEVAKLARAYLDQPDQDVRGAALAVLEAQGSPVPSPFRR
jgi:hypothetical protein